MTKLIDESEIDCEATVKQIKRWNNYGEVKYNYSLILLAIPFGLLAGIIMCQFDKVQHLLAICNL